MLESKTGRLWLLFFTKEVGAVAGCLEAVENQERQTKYQVQTNMHIKGGPRRAQPETREYFLKPPMSLGESDLAWRAHPVSIKRGMGYS